MKNGEAPGDNEVVIMDITVYFRETETQNQRHEVCLNYRGSDSGASSRWCQVFVGKEEV